VGRVVRDHWGLTPRQGELLAVIIRSVLDRGRPPSYREIAGALGFAGVGEAVASHLRPLARKGWVEWREGVGTARRLRVRGARWRAAGGGRLRLVLLDTREGCRLADWISGKIALRNP